MSNKENKKKIREDKKQSGQRREKRNALLQKVAIAVLVPVILLVLYQGLFSRAPVYAPDEIAATDHVKGSEDAALTITVYADFQCPLCLTEAEIVATAWSRISDKARFVYRYYPLDTHRHSFIAARYAEAASKQDSFWPMHDLIFANQAYWANLDDASVMFEGYARDIALDMDQLHIDLDSDEVRAKIVADQQGGTRAGVRGTPVMFFNGRRVNNPSTAGELIKMVDEAI